MGLSNRDVSLMLSLERGGDAQRLDADSSAAENPAVATAASSTADNPAVATAASSTAGNPAVAAVETLAAGRPAAAPPAPGGQSQNATDQGFGLLEDRLPLSYGALEDIERAILDNICSALSCTRADVSGIEPIKDGLTNLSFKFDVAGQPYVYRHPGPGSDQIINRESEAFSLSVAQRLGVDGTFVYQDPESGWKISRFIEGCEQLDYENPAHVARAMELIRRVHSCGVVSCWTFDVMEKARAIVGMLGLQACAKLSDFDELSARMESLSAHTAADGVAPCLCHNDFYAPNFLVRGDEMHLIDWEYSAMSDYASDLGTFICCSEYTPEEALGVIEEYFEGAATPSQVRHCLAYVALAAYYWLVWALYKEETGDPVGSWLELWHGYAADYSQRALALYEAARAAGGA